MCNPGPANQLYINVETSNGRPTYCVPEYCQQSAQGPELNDQKKWGNCSWQLISYSVSARREGGSHPGGEVILHASIKA